MKKYIPPLVFALVSLIIISPFFLGKYVLLLDTLVSPTTIHGAKSIQDFIYGIWINRPNQGELGLEMAKLPLFLISIGLGKVIPTFILQKIEMFLIFFLAMWSMYSLVQTKSAIPRYFAAFLYAINPFVYFRFIAGHWLLLLGYAVFPFFLKAILEKELNTKKVVLWLSLIVALSTHMFALAAISMIIFFQKHHLKKYVFIIPLFLLLNLYWIYPTLTAPYTSLTPITSEDADLFQSRDSFGNILLTNAMMYGFWRANAYEKPGMYYLIPFFIIILFLAVHGTSKATKRFAYLAVIALLLAVGIAHPWTEQLFRYLFEHIPFMKGFREPNKFVALLVLSYAYLGAKGLETIKNRNIAFVFLLLPFLFTPHLFLLNQQIKAIDYPSDYYEINTFLNQDPDQFTVLFLPWHMYLDFDWVKNQDQRIANPSSIFFDKPVIKGDNMELGPIYSTTQNPVSRYVQEHLNDTGALAFLNIKYILVAKEFDQNINEATLIKETPNLKVYKTNYSTNLFLQSNDLQHFEPIAYKKISPIQYEVNATKHYVAFIAPYHPAWLLATEKPLAGYPVVMFENNGTTITYSKFKWQLIFYLLSLTTFIWIIKQSLQKL